MESWIVNILVLGCVSIQCSFLSLASEILVVLAVGPCKYTDDSPADNDYLSSSQPVESISALTCRSINGSRLDRQAFGLQDKIIYSFSAPIHSRLKQTSLAQQIILFHLLPVLLSSCPSFLCPLFSVTIKIISVKLDTEYPPTQSQFFYLSLRSLNARLLLREL